MATFLFGVAAGNLLVGIPVDAHGVVAHGLFDLLRPYPILFGLLTVSFAAMHGAIYLYLKTEGKFERTARRWMWLSLGTSSVCYFSAVMIALILLPDTMRNFRAHPWAWGIVVVTVLALANIARTVFLQRPLFAFISSSCAILTLIFMFAFSLYPNLVISSLSPSFNLTIFNSASSAKTLKIMTTIALIAMPIVLAYTIIIYRAFRGKVKLSEQGY